ncbi:unnamed protein product [Adineta ricciae]|uniref:BTB domain-containing protein n=1 Tax=Adineta ricciae TaxID=249248 RepID=A0A814BEX9_ADIRI|nr:unnamed protein product [Adineta ricciae]
MPVTPIEIDCTPKCRSTTHYLDLIRIASQSIPVQVILNYLCRCGNCAKGHDKYGRTLLQICSALPDKWPVIDWLLKQKKVDINSKNLESGYTALHYSVFYGRIDNTINLIKAGANTNLLDYDHLSYIDHVVRDTHIEAPPESLDIESYEVYTMGENTNGNLGHIQSTAKKVPELIETFRRDSVCIKKIKMDKYHTLFLSDNGSVYSCGFGVGGRLGHDSEEPALTPKLIMAMETIKETEQDHCVDIAVTRDCSYFLTEKGCLWSCGLNNYQQLGHPGVSKVLVPAKMQFRQIKDRKVTHIACGRFHVALIVDNEQLFTFGLNAGHLGHLKSNDLYIQQPLLVTKFNSQVEQVQKLVCSDYAIVCYTNKDAIYILNDYKYRKIVKHVPHVTELAVVGGKLESNGILDDENIDDDLKVFYVQSKKLYLYHERDAGNNRAKLCVWSTKQRLTIEHIEAGTSAILFTTNTGQVYTASLDKLSNTSKKVEHDVSSNSIYDERAYQYLSPSPIPLLHRCRAIATDRTGRSLAALQYHPTTHLNAHPCQPRSIFQENLHELLSEAEHTQDITLEINNNQTYSAHKYILSMRSPYFRERVYKKQIDHLSITTENNSYIDPGIFQLILEYIYTDKCPWLNFYSNIKTRDEHEYQAYLIRMKSIDDDIDDHRYFTRVRQQTGTHPGANQSGAKSKKKKKTNAASPTDESIPGQNSDVELNIGLEQLTDLAKLLQLHSLRKRLDTIKQSRQRIATNSVDESIGQIKQRYHYTRDALPDLHDVTIVSEDGKKISCHKCILTSRLDYFRSMFLADWIESQSNCELKMAIPADLLEIIIDYLYTDTIANKFSVEQLCQILVLSDQLLIERLKQICEFHIANLVTFRDAAELLQFAATYNAEQLKTFVEQFICRNLATFLEARLLDNIDQQLLTDLTKSYRNLLDCMNYRMITPYNDCPCLDDLFVDMDNVENLSIDIDDSINLAAKKQQAQQKRKQLNRLRTSESENVNKASPPISIETVPTPAIVARPIIQQEEKWTSVSSKKTSKGNKSAMSNNALVSPTRPAIPGAVYSQQEAEKFAAAKRVADLDVNTAKPKVTQQIVKPVTQTKDEPTSKNPWKVTTAVPPPIPLKSTFSTEKEVNVPKPSITRATSIQNPTRSIPISQPSPPQHDISNPWSMSATSPPSASSFGYSNMPMATSPPVMSFKYIQDQEVRAHEALRQISNKSLEKIQTEELAIQALHRLYNSAQEFDMLITVERVLPEIANPIWPRTSTTTTASSSSPNDEIEHFFPIAVFKPLGIHSNKEHYRPVQMPILNSPKDVLIEVSASSVNPIDIRRREGYGAKLIGTYQSAKNVLQMGGNELEKLDFPIILGRDFCGTIIRKGPKVTKFNVGDKVFGALNVTRHGSFAQYCAAGEDEICLKPTNISDGEAAAYPLVSLTSWYAIRKFSGYNEENAFGRRALVLGAGGGVGHVATQLLNNLGMETTALCSERSFDYIRQLGVVDTVDYKQKDWLSELSRKPKYDLIFDTVGPRSYSFELMSPLLNKGGTFVTIVSPIFRNVDQYGLIPGFARTTYTAVKQTYYGLSNGVNYRWAVYRADGHVLNEVKNLIEQNKLKINIDQQKFSFQQIPGAIARVENGSANATKKKNEAQEN